MDGSRFCGACGAELELSGEASAAARSPESVSLEERKPVSVLFADIEASTELATRLDPEDLRSVLRPFFDAMREEIERHGGSVEKFIGDAVVGIFGAPIAHEDDPERAVRAALAMLARLDTLNVTLARTAGANLAMRIGVNTGEVLAASRAGDNEGLVTGEVVNLAARLQAAAPSGTVVVGERTYRDTRHAFGFAPLPPASLKGFSAPVAAWRVAPDQAPSAGRRSHASPLVGRSEEVGLLRLVFRRTVAEGRPNLVTLLGAAGIGKSRLADEFATIVRTEAVDAGATPAVVLRGRCHPYGNGLTYWPLAEMLKSDAGILDSDPPNVVQTKARTHLDGTLAVEHQTAGLSDVLLASIGVSTSTDPLVGTDSSAAQQAVITAWRRYLEARSSDAPLLAIFEDIHWADASLLNLVEALAIRVEAPVLLLCLARPDLLEHRTEWGASVPNGVRFGLSPLTQRESESLVTELLGETAPPDLLRLILDRAEGNPFFAEELIRMVSEDGTLERRAGGWMLARDLPTSLPDTIQAVILSRIDLLTPRQKRALQDAAVVGRVFWEGALTQLGDHQPATVDELIERGLVRQRDLSVIAGDRELAFSHGLTREVAYRTIPRIRRATAHGAVAGWIEQMTQGRDEEFAELLAHHSEQAGDDARTARYAMLAGHRHRRVFAAQDAIDWYDTALSAAKRLSPDTAALLIGETALSRGEAREQLGYYADARADYEQALQVAREAPGDRGWLEARALAAIVHVLRLEGRFEESKRLMPSALELARSAGQPDVEVRLLYTDGTTAFSLNRLEESRDLHASALQVAEQIGDMEGQALAHGGLAECHLYLGPLGEGLMHARLADSLLQKLGQRLMLHHNEHTSARILWMLGELDEAERVACASVDGCAELGSRGDQASALAILALIALSRGKLRLALESAKQALSLAERAAASRVEAVARVSQLLIALEMGHDEVAVTSFKAAASDTAEMDLYRPIVTALDGVAEATRGASEAALGSFREASRMSAGRLHDRAVSLWIEILCWERVGTADALQDAGRHLAASVGENGLFAGWARHALARAALLSGDTTLATTLATEALARSESNLQLIWRLYATLSRAAGEAGRRQEASDYDEKMSELVRQMADGLNHASAASFGALVAKLATG